MNADRVSLRDLAGAAVKKSPVRVDEYMVSVVYTRVCAHTEVESNLAGGSHELP